jgi:hypothetical protein
VKEKTSSPPLKKLSLTGQVCALAAGVNVRQHPGICGQRSKKRQRSKMCTLCTKCTSDSGPKWRFRTRKTVATFFLLFYAPKWPLFSIHTLKSAMPVTKWRFRTRKVSAIFSLNKDGGVFNGTMFDLVTNAQKRLIHFPQTRIESGILRTTVKWIKGGCTKIWLRICIRWKGKGNSRLISFRIFISLFADTDVNTEKKSKH